MSVLKDVKSEIEALDQSKPAMRKFGLTMAVVLALIGGAVFWKGAHPDRANILWMVGAAFLACGGLAPALLKPIYKLWMGLAALIGWFVSRLLLSLLFFLAITPVSLVMKLLSRDVLNENLDPEATSYWIRRARVEPTLERYKKLH